MTQSVHQKLSSSGNRAATHGGLTRIGGAGGLYSAESRRSLSGLRTM